MISFIEYVVAELKSKRLSKTDAASLVKEFSRKTASTATTFLHPLLHSNVSDLTEQRYRSTFTGAEFFLADHLVRIESGVRKVLPGVAYLEMVRAAVEDAAPLRPEGSILELHNVVWAQPLVVTRGQQVDIVLLLDSDDLDSPIEIEVSSDGQGLEAREDADCVTLHSQGRAVWTASTAPAKCDLGQMMSQMEVGLSDADSLYAAFARLGLAYGPGFQTIRTIHRGKDQVLARLQLPREVEATLGDFVLHPSILDGALQACVALVDDGKLLAGDSELQIVPRLPFSLDLMRILSPCKKDMFAWVRYAPGRQPGDAVVKLDINLLEEDGTVVIEMHGFSSRPFSSESTLAGFKRVLLGMQAPVAAPVAVAEGVAEGVAGSSSEVSLQESTEQYLRREFSELLHLSASRIDAQAPLEEYGIDSILAMKLTGRLEKTFGSLSKTLFFEYQTIAALSGYLILRHEARLRSLFHREAVAGARPAPSSSPAVKVSAAGSKPGRRRARRVGGEDAGPSAVSRAEQPIAIVGLSGRYPEADNLEAYWRNLRAGRDCIVEVPRDRWDWRAFYSADRTESGRHYSKWGGFLADVDKFDPLFFNISPREAELMDPQERLFLEQAWMAVEDAGYTRASLQTGGDVGVYVGLMYSEYQLLGAEASLRGRPLSLAGSAASIANRVSYVLNLHGPSMTLDTMCSSSLTAIHLACQDLKHGRTGVALAGGVNLSIHPNKYLLLSTGQFISSDGHCQSFGEGGDGYIPGEGVGVAVLKRLADAERDGDHIYGIVRGSGLTHGGKTNGYTVPNPQSQASAIGRALKEMGTDARHISYIEAHGTGTRLGDPIEIAALSRAFAEYTGETGFCLIGSAKSNIGHCESAAGIAGLTKVLLQMRAREIVASLHSSELNPHIDFAATPFVVNQELRSWDAPVIDGRSVPRLAGVSSFGAGGSNAHLVVEEYAAPGPVAEAQPGAVAVLLSARTAAQLRRRAEDLLEFVRGSAGTLDLHGLAYTLQVGREAMEHRLGLIVDTVEHMRERLEAYAAGGPDGSLAGQEGVYAGQVRRNREASLALFSTDPDLQQTVTRWLEQNRYARLLELWCQGLEVDWRLLAAWRGNSRPRRLSLPVYPFARERFWIDLPGKDLEPGAGSALHPLLHRNTSDLSEQRYSSVFTGAELFLADHRVSLNGHGQQKVLPAVAYLEMARAAVEQASPAGEHASGMCLELRHTVWARPVVVEGDSRQVSIALREREAGEIGYEIYSRPSAGLEEDGEEVVHCQGEAGWSARPSVPALRLEQLKEHLGPSAMDAAQVYAALDRLGLHYGPSHRGIVALYRGLERGSDQGSDHASDQVLAELRLPLQGKEYVLSPGLLDSALQAAVGLGAVTGLQLPFALETLRILHQGHDAGCGERMWAWVRASAGQHDRTASPRRLDIDLCDPQGNVCVQIEGLSTRAPAVSSLGTLFACPVWRPSSVGVGSGGYGEGHVERHVVLCAVDGVDLPDLESRLLSVRCVRLDAGAAASDDLAGRYSGYALSCFGYVRDVLLGRPGGPVLVQVVVGGEDAGVLSGLSGLLRTAGLENPLFHGQLVVAGSATTGAELAGWLGAESTAAVVRYTGGVRETLVWEELGGDELGGEPAAAFRDEGVYLITGGLGGLGLLFAREILSGTGGGRVVLTGRSALSEGIERQLAGLAGAGRVSYRQMDLGDAGEVNDVVRDVVAEYGGLHGILHCAGGIADNFLIRKSSGEFLSVLEPKVAGTLHLDVASRDVDLDFVVLFSSVAGALGNVGQADYAAANSFLDRFASYRNGLVASGARRGVTRSVNWPLWREGGMGLDDETRARLTEFTGIEPMRSMTGMDAFRRCLALPHDQMLVAEGDLRRMRRVLLGMQAPVAAPVAVAEGVAEGVAGSSSEVSLQESTEQYLRREFSELLHLAASRIDAQAPLEEYGIDSILAMKLTGRLEKTFGSLSKTLFFEYQTIAALSGYLILRHEARLRSLFHREAVAGARPAPSSSPAVKVSAAGSKPGRRRARRVGGEDAGPSAVSRAEQPIAIVGLSGRYPEADNLEAYWRNLRAGRDCIVEVPRDRWDWRAFYSADRTESGRHYSKWGGFLADVDKFDPLFFNISPREAELMDPQERLFLEQAWMAVEDAGYTRASLQTGGDVGVYVGLMYSEYQLLGAEASLRGRPLSLAGSAASIANRVSYVLNLHGPSMTLDTMCSSSLTAIHLACQDLKHGRTGLALAGGVNLSIHPNKYLLLSTGQFISSDGHCQSFGEGGDGYIPGEGVGVAVLKRLADAERDGDHIYGIVRGSGLTHGGKTNGYTVPNPQSQASAIGRALKEMGTDARHISYIEAHGTGTRLGDPIEIAALSRAFAEYTGETGFCLIGSAKSNIGHCESAAGIAGLTKVLLQMRAREIVASLHSSELNPHIDFAATPFVVNQELRSWDAPVIDGRSVPRLAGVSSFGAGGSNAHLVVEEYAAPGPVAEAQPGAVAVLLSARTAAQLRRRAEDLLEFVRGSAGTLDLHGLAYTLQVGREAMEHRLGLIVDTVEHMRERLEAYAAGGPDGSLAGQEGVYAGQVRRNREASLALFSTDPDLQQTVTRWLEQNRYARLLELWCQGLEVDWRLLAAWRGNSRPRRLSLPVYPFARERFWIDLPDKDLEPGAGSALHPLLHRNTSDLSEQRYSSVFTGAELFLADHRVSLNGHGQQKVLPAVAYLEMARAAVEQASPAGEHASGMCLELRHTVWARPVVVEGDSRQVSIALREREAGEIGYEIYSRPSAGLEEDGEEVVHCQGEAGWSARPSVPALRLEQLKEHLGPSAMDAAQVYAALDRLGLHYGPSHRGIVALYRGLERGSDQGSDEVLAELRLPLQGKEYVLSPGLLDSALQAAVGLGAVTGLQLPFALETLRILHQGHDAGCGERMWAWVRASAGQHDRTASPRRLDIDLCDPQGNVCVQIEGLATRAPAVSSLGTLFACPVWRPSSVGVGSGGYGEGHVERHVVLCAVDGVDLPDLESRLLSVRCVRLDAGAAASDDLAGRYSGYALSCFGYVRDVLLGRPGGPVLVQVVVGGEDAGVLSGLSGLLRTAGLENPLFHGQLVVAGSATTGAELAGWLGAESTAAVVRYTGGVRETLVWEELGGDELGGEPAAAFRDEGVYLITGGLGGLGLLFAREILSGTGGGRVVLTGRSALSEGIERQLAGLAGAGRVSYRQMDLGDAGEVNDVVRDVVAEYGGLHGILHCAGGIADNFLIRKSSGEFLSVLEPKVAGTLHLDVASRDVDLDFVVLFSSVAGALGNVGQADYAAANSFLDRFASYRNGLVASGARRGVTRSVNWPLWREGGMGLDDETRARLTEFTGIEPMRSMTGMDAFRRCLALPHDQMLVAEGDLRRMRRVLLGMQVPVAAPVAVAEGVAEEVAGSSSEVSLQESTEQYLRREFSELLHLSASRIDAQAPLEEYGIDSILAMKLTGRLEKTFGSLSKTLFFEYQTIAALSGYLIKTNPDIARQKLMPAHDDKQPKVVAHPVAQREQFTTAIRPRKRLSSPGKQPLKEIAIVGLAGRYPDAENLEQFWANLRTGRDCITEVPLERWNHALYYDPDPNQPGKSYSKWGGFLADVDKFDPLFFNMSPKDAELIDPQERLFLETAWETIEDAGYSKQSLAGSRVGVFVGVMWGQYDLFGAESILRGRSSIPGSSHASIANRVSYFFDFHGPSIALDTMCSSSLTAIHLACEEIRKGEIDAAIAGGVNVSVHPYKYLSLSQGKFAASDGKCRSFGAGGDGYVPGEGVGAVLLKSLEHALRDGDHIYGVVKASAINHGGKTNGYTVPNPNAQAELILDAITKAKIEPRTLSFIESHGTGTSLGDPIEVTGLSKAFSSFDTDKQFCPIGSVKSNIGHLESAAGIAGVTKALLQIKYEELVPSLHASPLNPNIDFENSPFYVQTELTKWDRPALHPRRVGVSSFGAGGSNAHIILEEYSTAREAATPPSTMSLEAFILSARDHGALYRYAERAFDFLATLSSVPLGITLTELAYTSQVGRTAMDVRLVILAWSLQDLREKLERWLAQRTEEAPVAEDDYDGTILSGNLKKSNDRVGNVMHGAGGDAFLAQLLRSKNLEKIAKLWTLGVEMDWSLMYQGTSPKRVSFPTYPFAKERYWVPQELPLTETAECKTLVTQEVDPVEQRGRTHYHPVWIKQPLPTATKDDRSAGNILVLNAFPEWLPILKEKLGSDGVFWVVPGDSFCEIEPNVFTLDVKQETQFQELILTLKQKAALPGTVLHLCLNECDLSAADQVASELARGVYSLLYLSKALMKEKHSGPVRFISVSSGSAEGTNPLGAATDGFLKSLALENPNYLGKVLVIPSFRNEGAALSEWFRLILNEVGNSDWSATEVRYRIQNSSGDPHEYVRFIRRIAPLTTIGESLTVPLKHHGVYLITGGLGALGLVFAEYLASRYAARLVLIGRSLVSQNMENTLRHLEELGAQTLYVSADVTKLTDLEQAVRQTKNRFSTIDGVIHGAGVTRDGFVLKKNSHDMDQVLAPKIYGAINLDLATSGENLDFFVLFSSIAGVLGNFGQSDYAYGNHFMDSFAEMREQESVAGRRSGRTLSINWPYWRDGGMSMLGEDVARLEKQTGSCPMPDLDGTAYFEEFLRSSALQGVALYGIPGRIAAYLNGIEKPVKNSSATLSTTMVPLNPSTLLARTEEYLKVMIGAHVKVAPERIGSSDRIESFGVDSVIINHFNADLEQDLGEMPKTLLYEHETVRALARFLTKQAEPALRTLFYSLDKVAPASALSELPAVEEAQDRHISITETESSGNHEPIAIIGIHGYYPGSPTLDDYWDNLQKGRELITLVPPARWDAEQMFDPDPAAASQGKIYGKWGGLLDDYDKFDPHFFNISEEEAKMMDPQERLFLESVWAAIEDAGYTREDLRHRFAKAKSADVGVFVGVTTNSYHLWAPEEHNRGSALPWSIANRVSYFFDFSGPSMPIDTACSSSLVAVHLACESLRNKECQVAIAGGVNLYLHPAKYQSLCQRRMLSLNGKCCSYGAGEDGFVPGEGVGSLVLKQLSRAIQDKDHIYAVIPGSAYDHSGRSNGYSAPNPNSQAHLISRTLTKAGVHPEAISYVEGHGTGTQLGDSIEVAALTQAFARQTAKQHFCALGSVKANIGHSESAAGIAGMVKVILQLQHRQLVPSINSEELNPSIEFNSSPFFLQHELLDWRSPDGMPRRALVNSFGAGGVNACVILEEYLSKNEERRKPDDTFFLFTLSAKNEARLRDYAARLLSWLRRRPDTDLGNLCYTLRVGREAMEERLAIVVTDAAQLMGRLEAWVEHGSPIGVYRGTSPFGRGQKKSSDPGSDTSNLTQAAALWVAGGDVNWDAVEPSAALRRIALPTYPFARIRYWISSESEWLPSREPATADTKLHPFVSYNSSTLRETCFTSLLSDTGFYALDHTVHGDRIFPAAAFLELACICGNLAAEQRVSRILDVVWARPLSFAGGSQNLQTCLRSSPNGIEYVISSLDEENESVVLSEGRLACTSGYAHKNVPPDRIDLSQFKEQHCRIEKGAAYYQELANCGFHYGPSFQTIQEVYITDSYALSKLKMPDQMKSGSNDFLLHPSIVDGAFQTAACLLRGEGVAAGVPFAIDEITIYQPLAQAGYALVEMMGEASGNQTANIRLLNQNGETLVEFRNFYVRSLISTDKIAEPKALQI